MRYILDDLGYIAEVAFGSYITCKNKDCTEYTGTIPTGYPTLEEWASNANIRAYNIVDGNLTFDSVRDEELQAQWATEIANNTPEVKGNKVTSLSTSSTHEQYPSAKAVYDAIEITSVEGVTAYYKEYKSTYTTTANNETVIPINISQFRVNLDFLLVSINGLTLTEGTDYTKSETSITLTKAIDKGTPVHFIAQRSVAATAEDYDKLKGDSGQESVIISPTEPTTEEKLWIQKGKNLYNKNNFVVRVAISSSDGTLSPNTEFCFCGYIPVVPNTTYSRSDIGTSGNTFLDKNKRYLSSASGTTFTTPNDCYYVGFNARYARYTDGSYETFMVNQGTTLLEYEPYIEPNIYTNSNGSYEELITKNDVVVSPIQPNSGGVWFQKGKNLFDLSKISLGSLDDGVVKNSSEVSFIGMISSEVSIQSNPWRGIISDFIKVEKNTSYTMSGYTNIGTGNSIVFCDFYDENKNWLSSPGKVGIGFGWTFTNEYNASYIRISIVSAVAQTHYRISNIQLEQGTISTSYEEYIDSTIYCKNDNGAFEEFINNKTRETNRNVQWHTAQNGVYHYEGENIDDYKLPSPYCQVWVARAGSNRGTAIAINWNNDGGTKMWINRLHDDTGSNNWAGWIEK